MWTNIYNIWPVFPILKIYVIDKIIAHMHAHRYSYITIKHKAILEINQCTAIEITALVWCDNNTDSYAEIKLYFHTT